MFEHFVQLIVNGLITGSILALTGVGASLVFGIQRIANFAHGEYLTIGAYVAFVVNVVWHQNLIVAAVAGRWQRRSLRWPCISGCSGPCAGAGPIAISLITVGLALVIRDALYLIAGSQVRVYAVSQSEVLTFGFVRLSPGQTVAIAVALVWRRSRRCSWRARDSASRCARSPTTATWRRSRASTWSAWASTCGSWPVGWPGLGGVMLALIQGPFEPSLGVAPLFLIFTTVVLGGIGSAFGALTAGLVLGLAMELSTWEGLLGGVEAKYKPVLAFLVLIVLLLYRPQGLFGRARVL